MVNSSNTLLFTLESIKASIVLEGSKSISNRVLMIRRMCGEGFDIEHISASEDTKILSRLLWSDEEILDAGDAGTTFRFLTSYLCTLYTAKVLTGSVRMKQRPIGPLVSALRELGANIEYLEEELERRRLGKKIKEREDEIPVVPLEPSEPPTTVKSPPLGRARSPSTST